MLVWGLTVALMAMVTILMFMLARVSGLEERVEDAEALVGIITREGQNGYALNEAEVYCKKWGRVFVPLEGITTLRGHSR